MKKALLLTDGSVDMALSLNRWLETQAELIELTVVYPYSPAQGVSQPVKAVVYKKAKQKAAEELNRWLDFLPQAGLGQLHADVLSGDPKLVLTVHLLLRQYDYLLIDFWQRGVLSAFVTCRNQITTQLRCLGLPEGPLCPPNLLQSVQDILDADNHLSH